MDKLKCLLEEKEVNKVSYIIINTYFLIRIISIRISDYNYSKNYEFSKIALRMRIQIFFNPE